LDTVALPKTIQKNKKKKAKENKMGDIKFDSAIDKLRK